MLRLALNIKPDNAEIHVILGLTYKELNKYKLARSFLEKSVELDPNNLHYKAQLN